MNALIILCIALKKKKKFAQNDISDLPTFEELPAALKILSMELSGECSLSPALAKKKHCLIKQYSNIFFQNKCQRGKKFPLTFKVTFIKWVQNLAFISIEQVLILAVLSMTILAFGKGVCPARVLSSFFYLESLYKCVKTTPAN